MPSEDLANVLLGTIHGFIFQRALLGLDAASYYAKGLGSLLTGPAEPSDANRTRRPSAFLLLRLLPGEGVGCEDGFCYGAG